MGDKESKPIIWTPDEKALSEAVDRVYKKYGTNLSAFFRDVHKELTLKRQESVKVSEGVET